MVIDGKLLEHPQKRMGFLPLMSLLICCAYSISVMTLDIDNPLIHHIIFFCWVVTATIVFWKKIRNLLARPFFVYLYIFLIYYFIASTFVEDISTSINRTIGMIELISPLIMYNLYSQYGKGAARVVVVLLTAEIIYVIISLIQNAMTGIGLRQDAGEEGYIELAYHWVYCLSILGCGVIYLIRKILQMQVKHKTILFVFLVAFASVICFTILIALFSTALITLLLGIVVALLYGRKKWKLKLSILVLSVIVLFSTILPFIIDILGFISPESMAFANRAIEISSVLGGSVDSNGSFGERLILTGISFETFTYHPLFGITPLTTDVIARLPVVPGTKIGNHAHWVDFLGLFGIFAFCLYFFLWKFAKKTYNPDVAVAFLPFVFLGFFNTCFYDVHMTVVFFYVPMLYDYIMSFKLEKSVK
jgi:hypothetical protein